MPISDRLICTLALGLALLAGCDPARTGAGIEAVRVSQQGVTVTGPAGFCIDPASLREKAGGSFVLLASCAALAPGGRQSAGRPAILTALVSPPGDLASGPNPADLGAFFGSRTGRAALANDGRATSVSNMRLMPSRDILYISLNDGSRTLPADLSPRSWRAVFALKGRFVVLSVAGLETAPIGDGASRGHLDRFIVAMRRANP